MDFVMERKDCENADVAVLYNWSQLAALVLGFERQAPKMCAPGTLSSG